MTVKRSEGGEIYYSYDKDNEEHILRSFDALHIPGLGFDGLVGHSPIAMAKQAIGMAIAKRNIDGAVAMIMALDRAIRNEGNHGGKSVYDSRGLLVF